VRSRFCEAALRAASRPGNESGDPKFQTATSFVIPGRASWREPGIQRCYIAELNVWIPGSLAQGRKRPGMTDMISRSRGAGASEVCQSLANRARGWSGGRRQDACEAPLEAGVTYPPRAARHRARPRQGAAPPGAPPAIRPSTVPGRPGPANFRSVRGRIASRKRPLIGQDARRIREVWGTGIGIHSQVRERRFARLSFPGRSAARRSSRRGALLSRGRTKRRRLARSRFCEAALRKCSAPHRARDTRAA